ncbi:FG-GAP repeat domain-containing protein [Kitasatospora aureofaciens]|uniref:FG-GAP repeat domain-containing protein n=1 Tax=Kitasatospora aureofaciens TaxID=1894 RepID=UPI0037C6002C
MSARSNLIRSIVTVFAVLVASLSFSVGQASAYNYPGPHFEIQNQATGQCLQASPDYKPQQLEVHDCGTSIDQDFSIWNTTNIIDAAEAAVYGGGVCLGADSTGDGVSVGCGTEGSYTLDWQYATAAGGWTPLINPLDGHACDLTVLGDSTVACMPAQHGSNAQWRFIYGARHYSQTVAGDFTGHGRADIMARDNSNGNLLLWVNNMNGGFQAPRVVTGGWNFTETTVGKFHNNGRLDLIAKGTDGSLYMWDGNGDGTFGAPHKVTDGWNFTQTAAADFDGDGNVDLIAKGVDNNLYMWPGHGDGTFGGSHVQTSDWNYTGTRAADFNNDGKADIMARDAAGNLNMWLHNGGGSFNSAAVLTNGWYFTQTAVGDFDGDGKVDLIGRDDSNGNLLMWPGNGDGTFGASHVQTGGW